MHAICRHYHLLVIYQTFFKGGHRRGVVLPRSTSFYGCLQLLAFLHPVHSLDYIKHILLLNIITIGLDTNYNNLQGSSPHSLQVEVQPVGHQPTPFTLRWFINTCLFCFNPLLHEVGVAKAHVASKVHYKAFASLHLTLNMYVL